MGNTHTADGGRQSESLLHELQELERRVAAVHEYQRQSNLVSNSTGQVDAPNTTDEKKKVKGKTLNEADLIVLGARIERGPAKILVGPVVGAVSEKEARVLLEVDRRCTLTVHVCVVEEECPGGREITSIREEADGERPTVFTIQGLSAGRKYWLSFSGTEELRQASFRTPRSGATLQAAAVCGSSMQFLPSNPTKIAGEIWHSLGEKVDAGTVDLVLHLGGQVDIRATFERCALLLQRARRETKSGDTAVDVEIERLVLNELRQSYRTAWSLEPVRKVLAHCSNIMIWSDLDIPTLPERNSLEESDYHRILVHSRALLDENSFSIPTYPKRLLCLAFQVFQDYQRALWDSKRARQSIPEQFTFLQPHPECGILLLDTKGSQFKVDGTATPWPQSPMISDSQWEFIQATLKKKQGRLRQLIVACDRPLVRFERMEGSNGGIPLEMQYDEWSHNEDDQSMLLSMLFAWKGSCDVNVVCGSGPFSFPAETLLEATLEGSDHPSIIRQVIVPPLSRCYHHSSSGACQKSSKSKGTLTIGKACVNFSTPPPTNVTFRHSKRYVDADPTKLLGWITAKADGKLFSSLLPALHVEGPRRLTLGPVIGQVSHNSVCILVEVDSVGSLTCQVRDVLTGEVSSSERLVEEPYKPVIFHFSHCLIPDRFYEVTLVEFDHILAERGPVPCFHTLPDPSQADMNTLRQCAVRMIVIQGDAVLDTANPFLSESETLWSKAGELVSRRFVEVSPSIALHLGGQVDLNVVGDLVVSTIRSMARGRVPSQLDAQEMHIMREKLRANVRYAYRLAWSIPEVYQVLSHTSNIFLLSEEDVHPPSCLKKSPDLMAWRHVVRQVALQEAEIYQYGCMLHHDTVGVDHDVSRVIDLDGVNGILLMPGVEKNPTCEMMLNTERWIMLEKALRKECDSLQSLLVLSDCPVVEMAFQDNVFQPVPKTMIQRKRWASFEEESKRLLQLLFAWRCENEERKLAVICPSPNASFQSFVKLETSPQYTIQQYSVGPLTRAVNPHVQALPFACEGYLDALQESNGELVERQFYFKHKMLLGGQNALGFVQVGNQSELTKKNGMLFNLVDHAFQLESASWSAFPVCASSWLLELVTRAQNAPPPASARTIAKEQELAAKRLISKAVREMREALPDVNFPEDAFKSEQGIDQSGEEEKETDAGHANEKDKQQDQNENGRDKEAMEEEEKNKKKKKTISMQKAFRYLDFEWHTTGPLIQRRLEKWHDYSTQDAGSEFFNRVEEAYLCHSVENVGIHQVHLPQVAERALLVEPSDTILSLCLPSKLQPASLTHLIHLALSVVLRKRLEHLQDKTRIKDPLILSEVFSICSSVGAMVIIGGAALDQ